MQAWRELKEKLEKQADPPYISKSYLVQWSKIVGGYAGHTKTKLRKADKGPKRGITKDMDVENFDVSNKSHPSKICNHNHKRNYTNTACHITH